MTTTKLSSVNGLEGKLTISGYALEDLAPQASFEECLYLLLNDRLPNTQELAGLISTMKDYRGLPEIAYTLLKQAAREKAHPMDALKLAVSSLIVEMGNIDSINQDQTMDLAIRLVSVFPTIIASYYRLLENKEPIRPNAQLDHGSNFLFMLKSEIPRSEVAKAFEIYLNTVIDHGLNASTFVARAIVSTESDIVSGVLGAIGSLKGPAHGGAPGPALDMVFEIGSIEHAEPYIRRKLENKERIMGFGHRVYKVRDPRAQVLSDAAKNLFIGDKEEFYHMVKSMERIIVRLLREYKPGRKLQTNVEFYTALVLHGCGLKPNIFSSIFAMGRIGGWTAHILEQLSNNRLIRPRAQYVGVFDRQYTDVAER